MAAGSKVGGSLSPGNACAESNSGGPPNATGQRPVLPARSLESAQHWLGDSGDPRLMVQEAIRDQVVNLQRGT